MGKILVIFMALLFPAALHASESVRIVAIVGGEPITSYELGERVKLARALIRHSGAKIPDAELESRVLDEMVGDRIKLAEAAKFGIAATPDEIVRMRARMEAALRLGTGGYDRILAEAGLDEDTLRSVLAADAAWMKFVSQVLRIYVQVKDGDIDSAIKEMGSRGITDYTIVPLIVPPSGAFSAAARVEGVSDCGAFAGIAAEIGAKGSGAKVNIADVEMQPALRAMVADAPLSTPLPPADIGGSTTIFFICSREARSLALNDEERERLKYEILQGKLDAYAAKYFEQIKAGAVIEIKD